MSRIGIIAGRGDLVKCLLEACIAQAKPYFVLAFDGQTDPALIQNHPHQWVDLAKAGRVVEIFKQQDVTEVVMAGQFVRPTSWSQLRPDLKGTKLLMKIAGRPMGDDGLFRVLVTFLEDEGFKVVSAESVIGNECMCPQGILTQQKPDEQALTDIQRGLEAAYALGLADIGQSVVVQQGIVLGVEAVEGTDNLIRRTALLKREGLGGVLVKIIKPGQETRVDRSVIGEQTLQECAQAGLRGVAVQAEGVILLGKDQTIKLADELGLFMVGVDIEKAFNKKQKILSL
jgi:DUF1009 family protein